MDILTNPNLIQHDAPVRPRCTYITPYTLKDNTLYTIYYPTITHTSDRQYPLSWNGGFTLTRFSAPNNIPDCYATGRYIDLNAPGNNSAAQIYIEIQLIPRIGTDTVLKYIDQGEAITHEEYNKPKDYITRAFRDGRWRNSHANPTAATLALLDPHLHDALYFVTLETCDRTTQDLFYQEPTQPTDPTDPTITPDNKKPTTTTKSKTAPILALALITLINS